MKKKAKAHNSKANQEVFRIAAIAAAQAFNVDEEDIVVSCRRPDNLARARQMTYWIMRKGTSMSLTEIGYLFPKAKDHGTILHGCRVMEDVFEIGDKSDNIFYKPSVKAAELFNHMRKKYIIARNEQFKKKFEEVING
tara:strand:- start:531 stop:944 length:414 start_codon:yes stop_codon:yes gene_type:complete